jgi:hypothetical protein
MLHRGQLGSLLAGEMLPHCMSVDDSPSKSCKGKA